jgi:hypothetical protein
MPKNNDMRVISKNDFNDDKNWNDERIRNTKWHAMTNRQYKNMRYVQATHNYSLLERNEGYFLQERPPTDQFISIERSPELSELKARYR